MASSRKSPSTDSPEAITAALGACLVRRVRQGQHLLVGLSGGVDSVVLLHALVAHVSAASIAVRISSLHVHHGISTNADDWETFSRQYSERLGVPFRCVHVAVERGSRDGLEAAARRARHAALAATDADWLMLAHHRDDQAETLLFNLLRGTGLAGAAAMRECSGRLLRPLLTISREEIETYARSHHLEWIEDESNADLRHARNFLRKEILPELVRRFPAAVKNLAGATARFAEANDLLDDLARMDLGSESDFPLPVAALATLDETRARNALRYLLARRRVMIPSEARLREALRQLLNAAPDRHPALTLGRHRLCRRHGRIYLESVAL